MSISSHVVPVDVMPEPILLNDCLELSLDSRLDLIFGRGNWLMAQPVGPTLPEQN